MMTRLFASRSNWCTSLSSGWTGLLSAALAGALATPAFGPWNIWPLALVSLTLLQLLLSSQAPKRAAKLGFAFAFGLNLPGLWWIHISMTVFGGIALPVAFVMVALLAAYLALFPMAACWVWARLFPQQHGHIDWLRSLMAFPALWLLSDWAMGHVLTGFPWLWFGYSQINSPLVGIAPLLGVQGVTLLLLLSSGGIALALRQRQPFWLLLPVAAFAVGAGLQPLSWTTPGKPLNFALMQGNIAQEAKWDPKTSVRPCCVIWR